MTPNGLLVRRKQRRFMLDDRVLPSKIIRKKNTDVVFVWVLASRFFFLLAPEEGLFFKPKYWQICLNIYIFVLFFCLLHRLAVRISLPFYIFYKLLLYWSRSKTGRSGTTQRFVAVDLLTFYILWNFNSGFFFFCWKFVSGIIFFIIFRASRHRKEEKND